MKEHFNAIWRIAFICLSSTSKHLTKTKPQRVKHLNYSLNLFMKLTFIINHANICFNHIFCFTAFSTSSKSSSSSSSKHSSSGHSSNKTSSVLVPKINITADKRLQIMKKNAAKKQEKRKSNK